MKNKKTLEDWIKIGVEVKKVTHEALYLKIHLENEFGKTHPDVKRMKKAYELIETMRSNLEDQLFNEHPEISKDPNTTYDFLGLFYGDEGFKRMENNSKNKKMAYDFLSLLPGGERFNWTEDNNEQA